ncbi:hypothetical protein ebA4221 [Aromatoleum aromaticum EbN1]|uniref:Uncharacterized protein n=1 Tax=Aromatoleum aromaticum (strain DSM 19018 / LMG 30748 / EbN1) TaxID=76114 RepID=Q5P2F5_AROAE|nr:hypothetical protein ebA4221 [Aromatoleum aromaticum EbN1]
MHQDVRERAVAEQDFNRAGAIYRLDRRQQVARVRRREARIEDQVREHHALRRQHALRPLPEFARDQVRGNARERAVGVDDDRVEALVGVGDETPRVGGDKASTAAGTEELPLRQFAYCRVDIDVEVVVERFAMRKREAAGAEHQDAAAAKTHFVEHHRTQPLDVARVARRLAVVDYRSDLIVDPEHARIGHAGQRHRADPVSGVGGLDLLRQQHIAAERRDGDQRDERQVGRHRPLAGILQPWHQAQEQRRADEDRRGDAEPLHDQQRQRQRTEERPERRPVQRRTAARADAIVAQQVGQHRHRLAEQPRDRAQHAGDEDQVRERRRSNVREQRVDDRSGESHCDQCGGQQEVAPHASEEIALDASARLVSEREREQEEADRRRRHGDRAAQMRHQAAQRDDLRTE